ncbi:hypothetical protein BASA81_002774 [Batrachochytrium salamandrivorans]|nr:hypothetical protein BASA81_002774 [Batrachochytrium salamandrivorans]
MSADVIAKVLETPSPANLQLLQPYCFHGAFESRMQMYDNGVVSCLAKLVQRRGEIDPRWISQIWYWLHLFVLIDDLDDPRERLGSHTPSQICFQLGMFASCPEELTQNFDNCEACLGFVSWCSQDESLIPPLLEVGVHTQAILHIKRGVLVDNCLALLRSLSTPNTGQVRAMIRKEGGLDCVLPYLRDLKETGEVGEGKEDEAEAAARVRRGFRAASLVARLAGNDETGIGPQVLKGNPLVVRTLGDILNQVILAGAKGSVFGMGIAPQLITMDILVIAASDANKPLLLAVIPVLFQALAARGQGNLKLVNDIVNILLQLSFDAGCHAAMKQMGQREFALLDSLVPVSDRELRRSYENLAQSLFPDQRTPLVSAAVGAAGSGGGGGIRSLFSSVLASGKRGSGSSPFSSLKPFLPPTSSSSSLRRQSQDEQDVAANNNKHVMLSYNWKSKALVLQVDKFLKRRGIPTWMDEFDMGENLNDSMSHAVENASFVLAFITQHYKESGNCRKECEYADTIRVPIIYILAESKFKPTGWLALMMGKSLYISCTSVAQVSERIEEIVQRVKPPSNRSDSVVSLPPVTIANVAPAPIAVKSIEFTSPSHQREEEILATTKLILQQLAGLQLQVQCLQDEVASLKQQLSLQSSE